VALTLSIGGWVDEVGHHGVTAGNDSKVGPSDRAGGQPSIRTTTKGDRTTVIYGTSSQQPLEFEFKIRYKFIPRGLAVVR